MKSGSLTVVGTGIGFRRQLIPAAEAAIRNADRLLYQIGDSLTAQWLHGLNPSAESLSRSVTDEPILRSHVYEAMAERVVAVVAGGHDVCLVTYGHPGVYQHAVHRSMELVRAAGMPATMLPGISALDCLIADLGIEIGSGCQLLDASALVLQNKPLDPTSTLILFQIGMFGNPYYRGDRPAPLHRLGDRLRGEWGADQEATFYEAAMLPIWDPVVRKVRLSDLEAAPMTERTLVYLPPVTMAEPNVLATAEIAAWLARHR